MKEIGTKLQQARVEKGISLEEIVHHTHIQLGHLQKIESGKFDFLPRPYVTAFIKTFAQYVGLNGDTLIQRWHEKEAMETEALRLQQQQDEKISRLKNDDRPLTTVIAKLNPKSLETAPATTSISLPIPYLKELSIGLGIILLMAFLVFLMSGPKDEVAQPPASETEELQAQKIENPAQMVENSFSEVLQQAQQAKTPAPQTSPPANVLTLQARFENQTSMLVVTDGRDTTSTIYKAGATQTYLAKEKFNLRIRTGGSVTLLLAGKNLGTFGQAGKVVRLTITSAGIAEQSAFTPQQPKPPSALPLDTLSIRRPRGLN